MAQLPTSKSRPEPTRRSILEVRMDILKALADGCTKPTLIMHGSNTSWVILKRNLALLNAFGFVRESLEGSRPAYTITYKGVAVLRDYHKLLDQAIAVERGSFS